MFNVKHNTENFVKQKKKSNDNKFACFRNMFPENIIQATFQQVQTTYDEKPRFSKNVNDTNFTLKPRLEYVNEVNVLG